MLTRRAAACAGLLTVLSMSAAPAHAADSTGWAKQLGADFRTAGQITKGTGVTIAILSTGVDPSVRSLAGAVKGTQDYVGSPNPHRVMGTLLASFIAGQGPDPTSPFGIRGLAPGAGILSVRIRSEANDNIGSNVTFDQPFEQMARAIRYAADHGAGVILVDETLLTGLSGPIKSATSYALAMNSVVVSGNANAFGDPGYPTAIPGVIGVGAVNEAGVWSKDLSEQNTATLVAAPGYKMPATGPGDGPYEFWGASAAAAWVAAEAALIKAEHPHLTPLQVAQAIYRSARHPQGGYDTKVGYGIINPAGALAVARALDGPPPGRSGGITAQAHFGIGPVVLDAIPDRPTAMTAFTWLTGGGALVLGTAAVLLILSRRRPSQPRQRP
jgi:subtilisin family serine protease